MKHFTLGFLVLICMFVAVSAPEFAQARGGDDHSGHGYEDRDDDSDEDEDGRDDDDEWDDDRDDALEIEADVFTDTTVVKVEEVSGKKTVFSTDTKTKEAVIEVVMKRFGFSKEAVTAALEFEIEDRASRPQDRKQLNNEWDKKRCDDMTQSSSTRCYKDEVKKSDSDNAGLQAQIVELQKLLQMLIKLMTEKSMMSN